MEMTRIDGTVFCIDMPLDHEGNGPAKGDDVSITVYQVWDQVCNVICTCQDKEDAERIADLLNGKYKEVRRA
jgi:hypothetical protein